MTTLPGRCTTDEPLSAGEFEFQSLRPPYPCEAHGKWLRKLDDRMWAILLAACGGAMASVVTLLILLMQRKG